MNFDNAIADTTDAFPQFHGSYYRTIDTPENEMRWIVEFKGNEGTLVELEVILRDGGIVLSVINFLLMNKSDLNALVDTFLNQLNIV